MIWDEMRWDEENSGQMKYRTERRRKRELKTAPDHASYAKCCKAKAVYYLPSSCFAHTRIHANIEQFKKVLRCCCRSKMSAKENDGSISFGYLLRFDDIATAVPHVNFWIRQEIHFRWWTQTQPCYFPALLVFEFDFDASSGCTIFSSLIWPIVHSLCHV